MLNFMSFRVSRRGIPSMLLPMLILFKGFLALIGFEMTNLLEQASRAPFPCSHIIIKPVTIQG